MRSDFTKKVRLDQALVKLGIVETRTKSSDLIKAGFVRVNDKPILKSAQIIALTDSIVIDQKSFPWVSRGAEKLNFAKDDAIVMHPGPMNRGVEIDSELADDINRSVIKEQVEMGVAIRMAAMDLLARDRSQSFQEMKV